MPKRERPSVEVFHQRLRIFVARREIDQRTAVNLLVAFAVGGATKQAIRDAERQATAQIDALADRGIDLYSPPLPRTEELMFPNEG